MEAMLDFYTLEAETLNALGHPTRLEILDLLREGEQCVCHIQAVLDQRQAYVSQQLNTLRQAGLVERRKEGKRVFYRVRDARLFEITDHLKAFLHSTRNLPARLAAETGPGAPRQPCSCPRCAGTAG